MGEDHGTPNRERPAGPRTGRGADADSRDESEHAEVGDDSEHAEVGDDRLSVARAAARVGAEHALSAFRGELEVETKSGPSDLVTVTDREAQERACEVIERHFPDEPIVGEESEARRAVPEEGPAWVVDPIDGTRNFVRGARHWSTAVAALEDGEPVAAAIEAPALGDSYAADDRRASRNGEQIAVSEVGTPAEAICCPTLEWPAHLGGLRADAELQAHFGHARRLGAAQLELAAVAEGALDAAVAVVRGAPWDTIAGVHLLRTAGGRVTDASGRRWRHDAPSLVASNDRMHETARTATAELAGVDRPSS